MQVESELNKIFLHHMYIKDTIQTVRMVRLLKGQLSKAPVDAWTCVYTHVVRRGEGGASRKQGEQGGRKSDRVISRYYIAFDSPAVGGP